MSFFPTGVLRAISSKDPPDGRTYDIFPVVFERAVTLKASAFIVLLTFGARHACVLSKCQCRSADNPLDIILKLIPCMV